MIANSAFMHHIQDTLDNIPNFGTYLLSVNVRGNDSDNLNLTVSGYGRVQKNNS